MEDNGFNITNFHRIGSYLIFNDPTRGKARAWGVLAGRRYSESTVTVDLETC